MPATAALGGSTTRWPSSRLRAALYRPVSLRWMVARVSPGGCGITMAARGTSVVPATAPVPSPARVMSKPDVAFAALKVAHAVRMSLPVLPLPSTTVSREPAMVKVAARVLAPAVMATPGVLPAAPV